MSIASAKNWDRHVVQAEQVARSEGFCRLRDAIISRAAIGDADRVLDLGAGTGLLTLSAAPSARELWAVDVSPRMCEYLKAKARSAGLKNVEAVVSSIVSLPLVDESVDVAISNYCFHHLSERDKHVALGEVRRVLAPGGRLVVGDMMFSLDFSSPRSRGLLKAKSTTMLRRGPAGVWRLAKNAGRLASGRWERPVAPEWWRSALTSAGFTEVAIETLEHEGGIACAVRP